MMFIIVYSGTWRQEGRPSNVDHHRARTEHHRPQRLVSAPERPAQRQQSGGHHGFGPTLGPFQLENLNHLLAALRVAQHLID